MNEKMNEVDAPGKLLVAIPELCPAQEVGVGC